MLALAFSGGKDSLACWYLHRHERPIVIWVNAGKAYPETLALVDEVRAEAAEFIEVCTDRAAQNAAWGIPSDLVPIDHTRIGQAMTGPKSITIQGYLSCYIENISAPLQAAAKARGVTHLIRGQRNDDAHRGPARHGDVVDGITYLQPIETWTADQVLAYVAHQRGSLPDHYQFKQTSLDCYDCTAFAAHSRDRIAWMRGKYPAYYAEYAVRRDALRGAIAPWVEELISGD